MILTDLQKIAIHGAVLEGSLCNPILSSGLTPTHPHDAITPEQFADTVFKIAQVYIAKLEGNDTEEHPNDSNGH